MRKKILFITTRLPLPVTDGRSYTLNEYINSLLCFYDVAIASLKCDKKIEEQNKNLSFVKILDDTSFFKKILNVFSLSIFRGLPLQISGVYSKKNQKLVNELIFEYKPDIIICDMVRTSRYLQKAKTDAIKILDMDDVLSRRYKQSIKNGDDVLGQFRKKLPSIFIKTFDKLKINNFVLKFEEKRMRKFEIKSTKIFDKVALVSPIEVDYLSKESCATNVFVWPVSFKQHDYFYNENYHKKTILFVGNLLVSQNFSTLKYIIDNIFPRLKNEFILKVVGKNNQQILETYQSFSYIKFAGVVDDLESEIKNALCLLAPIQFGSGIKIKVLEAMSFGGIVITSKIGAEGISAVNNQDFFICKDDEEYINNILKLSVDENLRKSVSLNAYNYIKTNHNSDINFPTVCKKIEAK